MGKVLLIGFGGREAAICYSLAKSPRVTDIFALPGNLSTEAYGAKNISIQDADIEKFCTENGIDLVVIGPEQPLAEGLADRISAIGVDVFGPAQEAAKIESSKAFMKDFCIQNGIPTAHYRNFDISDTENIMQFVDEIGYPAVVKTDGLAAGKGVAICQNYDELSNTLAQYRDGKFGSAGKNIVIEEFLEGVEVSLFAVSDGEKATIFGDAGDYKKIFDGNAGANTGGMGAYSPSPFFTDEQREFAINNMINPLVQGMKRNGTPYVGVIFAGLILTSKGVRLIEFNARFGDPETQAIMLRLQDDLYEIFKKCCNMDAPKKVNLSPNVSVNLVLASRGYPESSSKGDVITGIENCEGVEVFHAGTKIHEGKIVTNGGRVLNIVASGENYQSVRQKIYTEAGKIYFDGCQYRKDIADI